jgi:hypothetical protein
VNEGQPRRNLTELISKIIEAVMNYSMLQIYAELMKMGYSFEKITNWREEYPRNDIVYELERSFDGFKCNTSGLLYINNWNLRNLTQPDDPNLCQSYFRKPKAFFNLLITKKGNLALDWSPSLSFQYPQLLVHTDWRYWDVYWPAGGRMPFNRVMMIRNFASLKNTKKAWRNLDTLILEAIKHSITSVYRHLERFIEIHKVTDLYLKYRGEHIIGWDILDVETVEAGKAMADQIDWIKKTCKEYSITPKTVLKLFKENGMKYASTARGLSKKGKAISPDRTKRLIHQIYQSFEIYDEFFDTPPPGLNPGATVIPVKFNK